MQYKKIVSHLRRQKILAIGQIRFSAHRRARTSAHIISVGSDFQEVARDRFQAELRSSKEQTAILQKKANWNCSITEGKKEAKI